MLAMMMVWILLSPSAPLDREPNQTRTILWFKTEAECEAAKPQRGVVDSLCVQVPMRPSYCIEEGNCFTMLKG